ncbi:MAG: sensor histidine kinase [Burkholderiales bacterium]
MLDIRQSIIARLVLGYGLLVSLSIAVVSVVFYFGTIGVLQQSIDSNIVSIANHETKVYGSRPLRDLSLEITRQLTDSINSDTEIFLLLSASGRRIAGNLEAWPDEAAPEGRLITTKVIRNGTPSLARLMIRQLPNGGKLMVGRDLALQELIGHLVWRSLASGAVLSILLVLGGAIFFRYQIGRRIGDIRRTAMEIEAGDLTQRIPVLSHDEFGLLNMDINRMLDRIEQLMEGVRHVSNAIAHDLRTPLGRIRSKLDDAVSRNMTVDVLADTAYSAIADIDELMRIFEKLLQIAEAESGMRTGSFETIDLNRVVRDMVELYDATADEQSVQLRAYYQLPVLATGDRNLLGSALASLIDNAIKYAGAGSRVEVRAYSSSSLAFLEVSDNGTGIPPAELSRVTERFYRVDQSRSLPGNGLGLSIVSAIATLHGGKLMLDTASTGLTARIVLPQTDAASIAL